MCSFIRRPYDDLERQIRRKGKSFGLQFRFKTSSDLQRPSGATIQCCCCYKPGATYSSWLFCCKWGREFQLLLCWWWWRFSRRSIIWSSFVHLVCSRKTSRSHHRPATAFFAWTSTTDQYCPLQQGHFHIGLLRRRWGNQIVDTVQHQPLNRSWFSE